VLEEKVTPRWRRALSGVGWWDTLRTPGAARLLALNALVDAAGTGLAAVCLPFLIVGEAGVSASGLAIALSVGGAAELLATVPAGALAGRLGVRTYLISAKITEAAVFLLLALAQGLAAVVTLAALAGVARAGANGLNQSLTVAVLDEHERAGALGVVRALRNVGYLLAGSVGSIVIASGSSGALRAGLTINSVSFIFGALCVAHLRPGLVRARPERRNWAVLKDSRYLALTLSAATFGSSLVVFDVGLPLWVQRHTNMPNWSVGLAIIVNTTLVIALQYAFARRVDTVPRARRSLFSSAATFGVMALLVAITPRLPPVAAVLVLILAAGALTLGELLESPAWWTLSRELAPADRLSEYLSAFDLSWAFVGIAGPASIGLIVAAGSVGWLVYAVAILLAAILGNILSSGQRAAPSAALH
jgi:MFS family permease